MKHKFAFFFLLMGFTVFSQEREIWRGQIVRDTTLVENTIIYNTNSQKGTVTDAEGYFSLPAAVGDTLVFSGLAVVRKKVLLTEALHQSQPIKIKLTSFVYELEAVEVRNQKALKGNSQGVVDQKYFDDRFSSPKHPNVYDGSFSNGTNFVRLYKDIVKLIRKSRGKETNIHPIDFSETVIAKFNYDFFTKTLQLEDHHIKLFLVFCETDEKARTFTAQTSKFELMDFLITKNTEFKRMATFGK